jgi:hypothetical protein
MRAIALMKVVLVASYLVAVAASVAHARVDIYIDKSSQRMTVSVDGVTRYNWKVSTGKFGYATPSGTFRPFRMERDHFSREWDDAPMPNSIFFTYRGHAIHGSYYTSRLGRAVSHGCVRLAPQNAARLYSLVARQGMGNTRITIAGGGIAIAPATREIKKFVPRATRRFGDWLRDQQRQR